MGAEWTSTAGLISTLSAYGCTIVPCKLLYRIPNRVHSGCKIVLAPRSPAGGIQSSTIILLLPPFPYRLGHPVQFMEVMLAFVQQHSGFATHQRSTLRGSQSGKRGLQVGHAQCGIES